MFNWNNEFHLAKFDSSCFDFSKKIGIYEKLPEANKQAALTDQQQKSSEVQETGGPRQEVEMLIEDKISNLALRQRLPTIWDQYRFLWDNKKVYLPKWRIKRNRPKCITEKYLLGVLLRQNFAINQDQVKKPLEVTKSCTKIQLINILEELASKPLGFEIDKEPENKWLITMIYSLNPNHEIFKTVEETAARVFPKE